MGEAPDEPEDRATGCSDGAMLTKMRHGIGGKVTSLV